MTDYRNGDWWGWNGGPRPVQDDDIVELRWSFKNNNNKEVRGDFYLDHRWDHASMPTHHIVAFRVTKRAPPPPVERWAFCKRLYDTEEEAQAAKDALARANPTIDVDAMPITKWREVQS